MVHQGKISRWLIGSMLLAVNLPPLLLGAFPTGFALYFQVFVSLLIVLALFITTRTKIRRDTINYRMEWLGLPLFYKTVSSEEIHRIEFKRNKWTSKAAVVRMRRGLDLRFSAGLDSLFTELGKFAERNKIGLRKSKDYETFEKIGKNRPS